MFLKRLLAVLAIFSLSASVEGRSAETTSQELSGTVTVKDYARAEQFLGWNLAKLALNMAVVPHWIDGGNRFWFLHQLRQGFEFVAVEADSGKESPLFDQEKLARGLSAAAHAEYSAHALPFRTFDLRSAEQEIAFSIRNTAWICNLETYSCRADGVSYADNPGFAVSPDRQWSVFIRDHNLWARHAGAGKEERLTQDGVAHDAYGVEPGGSTSFVTDAIRYPDKPVVTVSWAPDSSRFVTYKLDESAVKDSYLVQSSPPGPVGAARPVLHTYRYPYPGDREVAKARYFIVSPTSKKIIKTDLPVEPVNYLTALNVKHIWWSDDSKIVYVLFNSRDALAEELYVVDANSGKSRLLLEETGKTPVEAAPGGFESPPLIQIIQHGNRVIWFSERDGWDHIYLYNTTSRALEGQITRGPWTVRDIAHVDEERGWIYFTASGRETGEDPYLRHLYRVALDGHGLELLTPENADHTIFFSPSGKTFVDTYSRADTIPVSVLRRSDGTIIRQLAEADISQLNAAGWKTPEPFTAKAADGVTDIYGVIFRPSNFDPTHSYPLIDSVYPGPQSIRTPKNMPDVLKDAQTSLSLAELGFIVITVDGRGTPFRSRAFHDISYGHLGDAGGLDDHVAAIRALAKRYPYIDLNRVGIYGHSGGGYASTRAILAYPDFYKVAVASAGNQDQRGYIAGWGERYEGQFDNDKYAEASNPVLALKSPLKGKLLLAWGDMDDNVSPALSLQLIDSLIKTNSDFDLLILPNNNHYLSGRNPYLIRRRWDYFVRNLLGKEPPFDYEIKTEMPGAYKLEPVSDD